MKKPHLLGAAHVCVFTLISSFSALTANASAITPGNILVSSNDAVFEYTTSGIQVQSFATQYPGGYPVTEYARDIAMGSDGNVHVYNGTFSPYMSTYNPDIPSWRHTTTSGYSTINNISYGGIDVLDSTVYVTDMGTAGSGSPSGVIAFDMETGTATRFAETTNPIDLTIGLDGLLYTLWGGSIYVYNPETYSLLDSVDLGNGDHRSIAINTNGDIFVAQWDGDINHLDSNGVLLNSISPECDWIGSDIQCEFVDIDISSGGLLALGTRFGEILLTDTSLTNVTTFDVGSRTAFVEFAPVPVPAAFWLFGSGLLGLVGAARRKITA